MTAREELEKATSRCKISRERRSLHAQCAEGGDSGAGRPPRGSEHDCMMLDTRSQKLGRGQRTVLDDRRADPQAAGEKSIPNSRTSNRVMSVINRADNTGTDSPDSA